MFLVKNLAYHSITKHIDVEYHFVRDMVKRKKLLFEKVDTLERITNTLINYMSVVKFS
jgi:hypothetical protein